MFHTYSTYARGGETTGGSYYFLDLTALGRQEEWEEPKGRAGDPRAAPCPTSPPEPAIRWAVGGVDGVRYSEPAGNTQNAFTRPLRATVMRPLTPGASPQGTLPTKVCASVAPCGNQP